MTEKQLREQLQAYLAPADLPASRKEALLHQISADPAKERGEPDMFRPNKFRTILVIAAIVTLLSLTVALAAGLSGYVDYRGKPVEKPQMLSTTPVPPENCLTEAQFDGIVNKMLNSKSDEQFVSVYYELGNTEWGATLPSTKRITSLEAVADLVGQSMRLPAVPEGFSLRHASVTLLCDAEHDYELVSEEVMANGVVIRRYIIPEGGAVVMSYSITLKNEAGDVIYCCASLLSPMDRRFRVTEADTVQTPAVPGMDEALLIAGDEGTHLYLRHTLEAPIKLCTGFSDTWDWFPYDTYTTVDYSVASTTVPADVLLSVFAQ
ncbi:MAG: hypothetical protein ACI4ME_06645 [Aristaeellaceae bacterium]